MARLPTSGHLQRHGVVVFRSEWDHGTPGVGAHASYVFQMKNRFFSYDMFSSEVDGPFESLDEALSDEMLGVSSATVSVQCSALTRDELINRLVVFETAVGHEIEVNGEDWMVPEPVRGPMTSMQVADWLRSVASRYGRESNIKPSGFAAHMVHAAGGQFRAYLIASAARIELLPPAEALAAVDALHGLGWINQGASLNYLKEEVRRRGII